MALIILEGLDRTGKSSVAQWYADQGYEVIHMSAPNRGTLPDEYVGEMVDLLTSLSGRNAVLDRSHYGELVWPQVYGRKALLGDDEYEVLREIEAGLDVERILMYDPNSEAHWQRCVDNKEPLTKSQFVKARAMFSTMADKYDFQRKTLKDFPNAIQPLPSSSTKPPVPNSGSEVPGTEAISNKVEDNKTKEQLKLERANAINEVLSKRILKGKGAMYDELERSVRHFLNGELGKIFGNAAAAATAQSFSNEEVEILRFFCKKLKEKDNG